jgi:hypothetical protein
MDFFQLSSSTIAGIIDSASTLIGNAMPLVVIILGIGIGLWILDHFLLRR